MILPCATGLELPQQRVLPYGWRVKRVVLRGPARLQLPEQGIPVQDERLQRVRVHIGAREDRLRRGPGRRRRQSGDVPVLLGL